MTQSFNAEAYNLCLRNDLNLLYTLCKTVNTLTKIDSQYSQDIAIVSAHAIYKTASEMLAHVRSLYEARNADKAGEKDQNA